MKTPLGLLIGWVAVAQAATTTTVVDIPAADGGTQRYVHVRPDAPIATLVNIPGGDGTYAFSNDGTSLTQAGICSPPYRNRAAFAERGIATAFIDATSQGSIYNFDNVLAVVRHVRARDNVPIWIMGGSASTAATAAAAAALPADIPAGVIFMSPDRPPGIVSTITRPAGVVYHSSDTSAFGNATYNALTAAVARDRSVVTAGSNAGCGFHLFNGADAEFVAASAGVITRFNGLTGVSLNLQGLWYKSPAESEAGWGLNIAHQGDILFITWFTYDLDGSQMWLVGSSIARTTGNNYSGTLYRTTGPAFSSVPFTPITAANLTTVGTATLSFTDASNGTFQYTVNGVTQSKAITRQVFGPMPTCTTGGAAGNPPNFQDLWYASPAESEAGWGLNVTHQGDIVFMTWFTYDLNGRGMWIVGSRMERSGTSSAFSGPLYRTTGPAFNSVPFTPITAANLTQVGTGTLTFNSASAGTFNYTVNGVTQTKNLVKQAFGPATVCR